MTKARRMVSLDEEVDAWVRRAVPNVSGFFNEVLTEIIELEEGSPEEEALQRTVDIRIQILKMQREVLAKEAHELNRQLAAIDRTLEKVDENPNAAWKFRLDTMNDYKQSTGIGRGGAPDDDEDTRD